MGAGNNWQSLSISTPCLFLLDTLACVTGFNPLLAIIQHTGVGEAASHRGGVGYAAFELIRLVKAGFFFFSFPQTKTFPRGSTVKDAVFFLSACLCLHLPTSNVPLSGSANGKVSEGASVV